MSESDLEADPDSVFLAEGSADRMKALEHEEELIDAWLNEIYNAGATESSNALLDMAANGIPIAESVRAKVGVRDLNKGPDTLGIETIPKPALEVGVTFSF